MICRSKLAAFVLLVLSSGGLSAKIIDIEPFKKSVISYCSNEANFILKKECLVFSGNRLVEFKFMIQNDDDLEFVKVCSDSINLDSPTSLYELLICSVNQKYFNENHPSPIYSSWILNKRELRTEWITICSKENKLDVSSCLESIENSFNYFWQDYINAKTKDDVRLISRCINQNFKKTNFLNYLSCKSMLMK